jgi:hypothetical protein
MVSHTLADIGPNYKTPDMGIRPRSFSESQPDGFDSLEARELYWAGQVLCEERLDASMGAHQPNIGPGARGLYIEPTEGLAVMYYHRLRNGIFDPFILHGMCPMGSSVVGGKRVYSKVVTKAGVWPDDHIMRETAVEFD